MNIYKITLQNEKNINNFPFIYLTTKALKGVVGLIVMEIERGGGGGGQYKLFIYEKQQQQQLKAILFGPFLKMKFSINFYIWTEIPT